VTAAKARKRGRPEDELVTQLHGFMKYVLHGQGDEFAKAMGELELSLTQLRALYVLSYDVEQTSLKELAEHLGVSLPAVSRSVDSLVNRGLVTRAEDTDDRRMKQVRATPAAVELVEHLAELRLAGIDEFVATLSARERARLGSAMALLAEREEIASRCVASPKKPSPSRRQD
jgi:DNA-binding MarR family transcriptional regulator